MGWSKNYKGNDVLHPDCCDNGKAYIFAWYPRNQELDDIEALKSIKPLWYINTKFDIENSKYPKCTPIKEICPWCGEMLPDFKLNDAITSDSKFTKVDNGYYCEECGERAMACQCMPPILLWDVEISSKNKRIPYE